MHNVSSQIYVLPTYKHDTKNHNQNYPIAIEKPQPNQLSSSP